MWKTLVREHELLTAAVYRKDQQLLFNNHLENERGVAVIDSACRGDTVVPRPVTNEEKSSKIL